MGKPKKFTNKVSELFVKSVVDLPVGYGPRGKTKLSFPPPPPPHFSPWSASATEIINVFIWDILRLTREKVTNIN